MLESESGRCRALVERWFHNKETNSCELFVWGGCGGNDNNFSSKEKCESYCKVTKQEQPEARINNDDQDVCGMTPETGMCRGFFNRFFFNKQSGKCEQFIFGGCGGNANNFVDEAACMAECHGYEEAKVDRCDLAKEVGMCRAAMPRWWHNKEAGVCEFFLYGGCDGNENNFISEEECKKACLDKAR